MSSCVPLDVPTPVAMVPKPPTTAASVPFVPRACAAPFTPGICAKHAQRVDDHQVSAMADYHHFLTMKEASLDPSLEKLYGHYGLRQFENLSIRTPYLDCGSMAPPAGATGPFITALRVQNLPMFQGSASRTRSSPADYIRYLESVLRKMFPHAKVVYIHTVHELDDWVEFVVRSDVSLDYLSTENNAYPVLMDRHGFHTSAHNAKNVFDDPHHIMQQYASVFVNSYTRMDMGHRHYLSGRMPTNLLKIQRIQYGACAHVQNCDDVVTKPHCHSCYRCNTPKGATTPTHTFF